MFIWLLSFFSRNSLSFIFCSEEGTGTCCGLVVWLFDSSEAKGRWNDFVLVLVCHGGEASWGREECRLVRSLPQPQDGAGISSHGRVARTDFVAHGAGRWMGG